MELFFGKEKKTQGGDNKVHNINAIIIKRWAPHQGDNNDFILNTIHKYQLHYPIYILEYIFSFVLYTMSVFLFFVYQIWLVFIHVRSVIFFSMVTTNMVLFIINNSHETWQWYMIEYTVITSAQRYALLCYWYYGRFIFIKEDLFCHILYPKACLLSPCFPSLDT